MMPTDDTGTFMASPTLSGEEAELVLSGELDAHTSRVVDQAVDELVGRGARRLVIDLAEVGFIDSSGLRSLIRARKKFAGTDPVRLREPQVGTVRLLEITGLLEQFPVVK